MKDKAKIIKTLPDNEYVVTKENKKFKAYFDFKEKALYFFLYVKYHNLGDVRELEKNEIDAYISFLVKKGIYLNKVIEKMEAEIKEKEETTRIEYEQKDIREKGEAKIGKVQAKLDKVNQKYEEAVFDSIVREETTAMDDELGKKFQPIEEEKEQLIEEPVLLPIEEPVLEPIEEEKEQPVEEAKVNPLEQNFNNFEEATKEIEQNCTDDLSKKISEIFALVKNESKELVAKQLSEMSNTAKEAIINANQHTSDVKNELAIVEKDRDQYRSHYEQTVEVVKQKDGIIKLRDNEISSLRSQLENKNNELNAANEREIKLNEENNNKDAKIKLLEGKVRDLNIAIRTIVGQALEPSGKDENLDDSVQPIDLGKIDEQEETTKTL